MRYLGIDFGTKRIGLAISDESGTLATPYKAIENNDSTIKTITDLCVEKEIGEIVIGKPTQHSSIEEHINDFVGQLSITTFLPVHFQNEEMSSVMSEQFKNYEKPTARLTKKDATRKKDESAAAIILQRFLDWKK